ncbi:helix-turn-helix transcriptional regulator [Faecalispora anaeroviscerum]|uniref:helix-turn-helix transcriptional regulator n=1 Tax=Faecalispora anaeroviscerum TaxID=2991836 RepID=UPI0024B8BCA0|nr:YafY family protein [Faecalispora anaeroviscerum]
MQIDRLFQIVYLLLGRKTMTAKELAEHFEVSVRTILRDIDTLSSANIPVYTTQGKGGGISILDSYVLNKAALSRDEQNQTLIALQSLAATGNTDAKAALLKLGALFQNTETDWLEVDFSRWGQGVQDHRRFELLKTAILGRRAICFEYVSAYGEESRRKVYPLKLVFKSKAWYLQGYCLERQDYRTFKINRVLHVELTDEPFPAGQYSPPPIESAAASAFSLVDLELEFSAQSAYRVYDEFDEGCIERNDDGFYHVFARLPEDGWLYSFLLSLGKDVKVLRPTHIADNLEKK